MRFSLTAVVDRRSPAFLRGRLLPLAAMADAMLTGRDDRAVSQRIALMAFMVRVVSAVLALASQALMARWMGDREYGIFVVVWVAAVIVGGFACLGFQISIVRFIPEYLERKEDGLLRGVILGARLHGFAAGTVLALIGAGGLYFFGDALTQNYYVIPFYLAAICLPMLAVGEIQDGVARAFNWAGLALWPTYIYRPLAILLFMWLAIWFGAAADAISAMAATIAATWLVTAVQALLLRRRVKAAVPSGPRSYTSWLWIAISVPMFLVEGFYMLLTNVDILLVGWFMPPEQVAIYFAAVKTLAIVHFVYFGVRAAAANRFSRYWFAGERGKLEHFVRDTLHWTFWPSLLVAGALLVVGKPLLSLFGPSFVAGYPLLFVFVLGLLARASVGAAESLLTMANQQRLCAAIYAGVFTVNVVLNVVLVPMWGLMGAAAATSVALFVEAVALYFGVRQRLGIKCFVLFAFRPPQRLAEVN